MSEWLDTAIAELLAVNQGQLSGREYRYVAYLVMGRSHANFLVFGTGRDTPLWTRVNQSGRTVFLESSPKWLDHARQESGELEAYLVTYHTRRSEWRELLDGPPKALNLALPTEVADVAWDVILVDAPAGYADSNPGRMQSIYTASVLGQRKPGVDVIVHDCPREVERVYCDRFLAPEFDLVAAFDRSRHYRSR